MPEPINFKPVIKWPTVKTMQALITNKNKPSVRMVTGKVSTMSKGLTVASKTASKKATASAV